MKHAMKTCARPEFSVSASSDWTSGVVTATPTRHFRGTGRYQKCELYGCQFATSDEAFAAMHERGYTQDYFSRPSAFIHLRLPRRVRVHLAGKPWSVRKAVILRLAGQSRQYVESALRPSREEWESYLDGKNPEFEAIRAYRRRK